MTRDKIDIQVMLNGLVEMILRQLQENSDQTGELVQTSNIQKLSSSSKLGSLIEKVGVTMETVTETESYACLDFLMFYDMQLKPDRI